MRHYDKRSAVASPLTMFGVASYVAGAQYAPMLSANELLTILRDKGVKNAQIERVLDLPSSRVSEIFKGERRLQLDEAKKLVEAFDIEELVNPVNEPIARLLVLHAAHRLGVQVDPRAVEVEELAQDFEALSQFALNPKVRQSVDAWEGFLQGLLRAKGRTSAA